MSKFFSTKSLPLSPIRFISLIFILKIFFKFSVRFSSEKLKTNPAFIEFKIFHGVEEVVINIQ